MFFLEALFSVPPKPGHSERNASPPQPNAEADSTNYLQALQISASSTPTPIDSTRVTATPEDTRDLMPVFNDTRPPQPQRRPEPSQTVRSEKRSDFQTPAQRPCKASANSTQEISLTPPPTLSQNFSRIDLGNSSDEQSDSNAEYTGEVEVTDLLSPLETLENNFLRVRLGLPYDQKFLANVSDLNMLMGPQAIPLTIEGQNSTPLIEALRVETSSPQELDSTPEKPEVNNTFDKEKFRKASKRHRYDPSNDSLIKKLTLSLKEMEFDEQVIFEKFPQLQQILKCQIEQTRTWQLPELTKLIFLECKYRKYDEKNKWVMISKQFESRSPKACRDRFEFLSDLSSISPSSNSENTPQEMPREKPSTSRRRAKARPYIPKMPAEWFETATTPDKASKSTSANEAPQMYLEQPNNSVDNDFFKTLMKTLQKNETANLSPLFKEYPFLTEALNRTTIDNDWTRSKLIKLIFFEYKYRNFGESLKWKHISKDLASLNEEECKLMFNKLRESYLSP